MRWLNELKCNPTMSVFHLDNRVRFPLSLNLSLSFCFVHFSVRRIYFYPEKEIIYILSRISFDCAALKSQSRAVFLCFSIFLLLFVLCMCVYFMPHRIDHNVHIMSIHLWPLRSRHNFFCQIPFPQTSISVNAGVSVLKVCSHKVNYDFYQHICFVFCKYRHTCSWVNVCVLTKTCSQLKACNNNWILK